MALAEYTQRRGEMEVAASRGNARVCRLFSEQEKKSDKVVSGHQHQHVHVHVQGGVEDIGTFGGFGLQIAQIFMTEAGAIT